MIDHEIAFSRAYARALYRSAVERQELEAVVADMHALAAQWRGSPELRRFCRSVHPGNARSHERLVDDLWGKTFTESVLTLLRFLSRRDQLALIPFILDAFHERYDRGRRCMYADVVFAVSPDDAMLERVRQEILKARGGTLRMAVKVDPELIAGFVITLEDQRIDASMAGRLKRLRMGLRKPGL